MCLSTLSHTIRDLGHRQYGACGNYVPRGWAVPRPRPLPNSSAPRAGRACSFLCRYGRKVPTLPG